MYSIQSLTVESIAYSRKKDLIHKLAKQPFLIEWSCHT